MTSRAHATQELYDRCRSVAFLVAFALLFDDVRARRAGLVAVTGAVVGTSFMHVGELLGLLKFADLEEAARVAGRAGGFFVDPNDAAMAIVFGLAIVLVELPRAWRVPVLLVGTVGVAATFSRGSQVCLLVLIACLVWRGQVSRWSIAAGVFLGATFLALEGSAVLSSLQSLDVLNDNTLARLQLQSDDSGRIDLARHAWRMFADSPLLGNGLGAAMDWADRNSSHNQFLNLAVDHGVLGLLIFPALGVALVRARRAALPFAVTLMAAGMFSHNLLGDRAALLAIALAASRATQADARQGVAAACAASPLPCDGSQG